MKLLGLLAVGLLVAGLQTAAKQAIGLRGGSRQSYDRVKAPGSITKG